jgi:hypothetical protein
MSNRKYDIGFEMKFEDKKIITKHTQDVEGAIASVKHLRNVDGGKKQYGYHAARIPQLLLLKWGLEDAGDQLAYLQGKHNKNPDLAKKLAARMNSNEFHEFRIWEGTIAASDMLKEGKHL